MVAVNTHVANLPGPSRKRKPATYHYVRTYHNDDRTAIGCLDVWEVHGGREVYQVAVEQLAGGWRHWSCTCPHAIYRAEPLGRACKHIIGLNATFKD